MTFVYVLISPGRDRYSAMARISIASVRLTNPSARIILLTDRESVSAMKINGEPLLQEVDSVREIAVPKGSVPMRSRHIKTRLGLLVPSPFIFLDADTVVRKPLHMHTLSEKSWMIAGCRNFSRRAILDQISDYDISVWEQMGWALPSTNYLNSGVLFFRETSLSEALSHEWHRLWTQQVDGIGKHTDQQSLNEALSRSGDGGLILPDSFNAQVMARMVFDDDTSADDPLRDGPLDGDAKVWHIFATIDWFWRTTVLKTHVDRVMASGLCPSEDVRRLVESSHPWRRVGVIDDLFIRFARGQPRITAASRTWFEGKRIEALMQMAGNRLGETPFRRRLGKLRRWIFSSDRSS